jgi:hypothetical protein
MYNLASSLETREIVYVSTNVAKGRPQLNSHRGDVGGRLYARDGIDGFPAWELAGLHTDYQGNNWEAKIVAFQEKWAEVEVTEEVAEV